MKITDVQQAIELYKIGHKIKFGIFGVDDGAGLESSEYHAVLFPSSMLHRDAVKQEMEVHPTYVFLGAGAVSKHTLPTWGSESCEDVFGYDSPGSGGAELLGKLWEEIGSQCF